MPTAAGALPPRGDEPGAPRRRVLLVTSCWSPAMIADMHRARHLAWELPRLGWAVEILAPDRAYLPAPWVDSDSAAFFPDRVPVHLVRPFMTRLFRALRVGNIGWRALVPMRRAGLGLLATGRFDLVYITTTQFPLFLLGPSWLRRAGVPYVLDLHDPCYRDSAGPPAWSARSLKGSLSRRLTRHVEARSVAAAAGLISVSPDYLETLARRYGHRLPVWGGAGRSSVIPFAALPQDFEVGRAGPSQRAATAGRPRIVYVGAGGPLMARAFALLCRVLAILRRDDPEALAGLRIELRGTMSGWRDGDRRHLAEVAEQHGIADLVEEDPRRISYRSSLELLLAADGALVLGVDEAGYTPSKLFSYAFAGRPLLGIFRRDSPAFVATREIPGLASTLWFEDEGEISVIEAVALVRDFLAAARRGTLEDRRSQLEPYLAPAMACRHAELFEVCLSAAKGKD